MKSPTEKICEVVRWMVANRSMTVMGIEDRSGIPRGSIGKWLSSERKSISAENAGKVLLLFSDVSADWVMRDRGEMFGDTPTASVPADGDVSRLKAENERLREMLDAAQTYIAALQQIKST